MRILRAVPVIFVLMLAVPGCAESSAIDDVQGTCNSLDRFFVRCGVECSENFDCVATIDSLDVDTQAALDECSDCLAINLNGCSDCDVGGASCLEVLATGLGTECSL